MFYGEIQHDPAFAQRPQGAARRTTGLRMLLECPLLWHEAYARIHANDGAITQGVDQATLDGFSIEGERH